MLNYISIEPARAPKTRPLHPIKGEMSERFKELVLKTSDPKRAVGSNPTLSASASGHSGGSLAYGCFVEPLESNPESELCRQRFFSL